MHTLVKRGPKDFYCAVCRQQWTSASKAHCPGLRVIKHDEWGALMTKTQLGRAGYKNTPADLPEPVCCYRASMDGSGQEYVPLYDPSLCTKKKPSGRPRKRKGYLSVLVVPLSIVPLIERYREACVENEAWKWDRPDDIMHRWHESAVDLCNAVQYAQLMDDDELARMGFITLNITPCDFEPLEPFTRRGSQFAHLVGGRILQGYRAYRASLPGGAEQLAQEDAAAQTVKAAQYRPPRPWEDVNLSPPVRAEDIARREAQFNAAPRVTWDEGTPPPVQRSLFNEGED